MDYFVELERLPEGLKFPADLAQRIEYDEARKRLVWHGPMSKCTFDRLHSLHKGPRFQLAIEELFNQAAFASGDRPTRDRRPWLWIASCVAALVILAGVLFVALTSR